jgi:hypothetical protein
MLKTLSPAIAFSPRHGSLLASRAVVAAVVICVFGLLGTARATDTATPVMPTKPVTLPAGSELQRNAVQVAPIPEPGIFPLVAVGLYLCVWKLRRRA